MAGMYDNINEAITGVAEFAERSRKEYASTKEWTALPAHSCETIRVPVALLNRIRDLHELFAARPAGKLIPAYGELVDALGKMIPLAAEAVTDRQATVEVLAEDAALVSAFADDLTTAREVYELAASAIR